MIKRKATKKPVKRKVKSAKTDVKKKRKSGYQGIKTVFNGIEFDSQTECEYYKHLLTIKTIQSIELHPAFEIIPPYVIECPKCRGYGKQLNLRTSNYNKCSKCSGAGQVVRPTTRYTADFKVTYDDGFEEIIDVKGTMITRDFPLRKKLLESQTGKQVVVVQNKKGLWVRK